jgi:RNA polymerase sigma-70 factor (ECF subfamily)
MDEAALIHDAQQGDVDAYNGLVLHYQTQVYNVAYRIMGEGDSAADATQEAFIRAYKNLSRFRGGNFRAWLLRIVTNLCYDELRRRKRRPASSLDALYTEDASPDDALHSESENPESYAQRMELRQAIEECLRQLSDDYRVVAVLSDVQGLGYGEIAESADIALGTVKSRLSRARAQLRECLQGSGELLPASYRLDSGD